MLRTVILRLRALFKPSAVEREIDEELRFHVDRQMEHYVQRGVDRSQAARLTQIALGGIVQTKEAYRDAQGLRLADSCLFDIKRAVRRLRKDAGVSAAAVLALALGIGAATAAFSLLDNLLLSPFPYKDADRLVTFSIRNLTTNGASVGRSSFTGPEIRAFKAQNHVFEELVATAGHRVTFHDGVRERALPNGAFITDNAFAFYGVAPLVGRGIESGDGLTGAPPVFVVDYRTWQSELAGDPGAVGRTFTVDGTMRTLVGVMPARFRPGNVSLWIPVDPGDGGMFALVGRLEPGVTRREAAADLDDIAHRFTKGEPGFVLNPAQYSVETKGLADVSLGNFKSALYALVAAAVMLLGIACVNVANLLIARASAREREMALCAALGASRSRLIQQLLAESAVLSAMACGLGCACAWAALKVVAATIPRDTIPGEAVIALNAAALVGAVGLSAILALLCGLAPALHAVPTNLQARLAAGSKGAGGGAGGGGVGHSGLRAGLVVLEVALSMVLLVGAALTLRSFFALTHENLPFDASKTLYARVVLPRDRYYAKPDRKPAFFAAVLSRIKALPGVVDATESLMLPPDEGSWTDIAIPGKPHVERWTTDMELCTDGYFRTLGIQLLRGRLLSREDVNEGRYVAVVNRSLARTYFGTEDPIGQTIKFEVLDRPFVDGPHNTYFEVVGVTADFRTRPGRQSYLFRPTAYVPASVAGFGEPLHILVKTTVDPHTLMADVSREVLAAEPHAALMASGSIADLLDEEFRAPEFEFVTTGALGAVGLILVAIGVFSVMAYTVSLQTYDIGIRMALGAGRGDILRMIFTRGASLIAVGAVIGVLASVALVRLIASLLWGTPATDPWAFGVALATVSFVGALACLLPARRAARVDPLVVLRGD